MTDCGQCKVDFGPIPWQTPMPGLRYKVYRRDGKQLRLVEYAAEMEPHWCEKGHIGYILNGRFEITFGGSPEVYEAGDGVFIPAGREHRHKARCLTPTVVAIFVEEV
jgi:quercetin dioxygenase-like cupin family protein